MLRKGEEKWEGGGKTRKNGDSQVEGNKEQWI
jgi:hypothetical protein